MMALIPDLCTKIDKSFEVLFVLLLPSLISCLDLVRIPLILSTLKLASMLRIFPIVLLVFSHD